MDEAEFRSLPASIAAARAYRALALGVYPPLKCTRFKHWDVTARMKLIHCTQATSLAGNGGICRMVTYLPRNSNSSSFRVMRQANNIANAISITYILANIKLVQGRLREAVNAYKQ